MILFKQIELLQRRLRIESLLFVPPVITKEHAGNFWRQLFFSKFFFHCLFCAVNGNNFASSNVFYECTHEIRMICKQKLFAILCNFINFRFMRTLDLNAYGVTEMNVAEMQKKNGGFWQFVGAAVLGGIIYDLLFHTGDCVDSYGNGATEANDRADKVFR
jgi:hypothetical protein